MSYDVFESIEGEGLLKKRAAEEREERFVRASARVVDTLGEFFRNSKDITDFNDRWKLAEADIKKIIESEVTPVQSNLRVVKAQVRKEIPFRVKASERPSTPEEWADYINEGIKSVSGGDPEKERELTDKAMFEINQLGLMSQVVPLIRASSRKQAWAIEPDGRTYTSNELQTNFDCPSCGRPNKIGFSKCSCGKQWNSYEIQSSDGEGKKMVAREVESRPSAVLAKRRLSRRRQPITKRALTLSDAPQISYPGREDAGYSEYAVIEERAEFAKALYLEDPAFKDFIDDRGEVVSSWDADRWSDELGKYEALMNPEKWSSKVSTLDPEEDEKDFVDGWEDAQKGRTARKDASRPYLEGYTEYLRQFLKGASEDIPVKEFGDGLWDIEYTAPNGDVYAAASEGSVVVFPGGDMGTNGGTGNVIYTLKPDEGSDVAKQQIQNHISV